MESIINEVCHDNCGAMDCFRIFYDVSFTNILITSVVLTAVGYVRSNVFILPRIGNTWAGISDFVIAYAVILFVGIIFYEPIALGTASLYLDCC